MRQGMGHPVLAADDMLNGTRVESQHNLKSPSIKGAEFSALLSALKLPDAKPGVEPDVQFLSSQPHCLLQSSDQD
jgi:hypothetical protein